MAFNLELSLGVTWLMMDTQIGLRRWVMQRISKTGLAESATDIGDQNPDVLEPERFGQSFVDHLGRLRVAPGGQMPCRGLVVGDTGKSLERRRAIAVNLQVMFDNAIRLSESALDVAVGNSSFPGHVGAELFVKESRVRTESARGVRHGGQGLVVDDDGLRPVLGLRTGPGREHRHGLAHVAHFLDGGRVLQNGHAQARRIATGLERFR